jgi:hypothetical protein
LRALLQQLLPPAYCGVDGVEITENNRNTPPPPQDSLAGCLLQQLLPPAESVDGVDGVVGGGFGAWLAQAEVSGASAVACLSSAVEHEGGHAGRVWGTGSGFRVQGLG